jgi:hypothetical protein
MDWFDIVKNPKLRTGSKITTTLGGDKSNDEDKPCNKKLKEYADKVAGLNRINEEVTWRTTNKTIYKNRPIEFSISSLGIGEYNPVPESVACFALKKLNDVNLKVFNEDYKSFLFRNETFMNDDYSIHIGFTSQYATYGIIIELTLMIRNRASDSGTSIYIEKAVSLSHEQEQVYGMDDDDWEYFNQNFNAKMIKLHSEELADKYSKEADWR